jgi:hypothetical protein
MTDARLGSDNDVKALSMSFLPTSASAVGGLELSFDAARLNIYKHYDNAWSKYSTVGSQPIVIQAGAQYYVEAKAPGTALLTLKFVSMGTAVTQDTITVKIPQISVKVRRKGTTGAYASSATIAAGHKDSDVHNAEIEVSTSPAAPSGTMLNFTVGKHAGQGNGEPDTGGAGTVSMDSDSTDADGKVYGTYRSSNKIENVTIECQLFNHNPVSGYGTASVSQQWDNHSPGLWDYDGFFFEDVYLPVSLAIEVDSSPITTHQLKFFVTRVTGMRWDECEEQWVELDETSELDQYSQFSGGTVTDGQVPGTYTASQIVHASSDWVVDWVYFKAEDQDVWGPPPE